MFLRKLYAACAIALLACGSMPALAQKAGTIEILRPWARASAPTQTTGAGYLSIRNAGARDDKLLSIRTQAAGMTEIHRVTNTGNMVKMGPVDGLAIPKGQTVTFSPGGSYHIMFMHIKAPFKQGDNIDATLDFAQAGKVDVKFVVQPLTYQPEPAQDSHMDMGHMHMDMDHGDSSHAGMKMDMPGNAR